MLWHRQAIFKSKGDKLCSSAECRIWTRGPRHQFASRLNARWQTDWAIEDQAKNLNSTARPYDPWAFSPLGPTVSWLSHMALHYYIYIYWVYWCGFIYIYIGKLIFLMTHSTYLLAFGVAFKCQQILLVPDWEVPDADETLGVVSQLSIKDATCWWNPGCGEPT